mmetsp:Transcript_2894/g.4487  ORF Transcript_2894/g.4487 Transcript_2894/m.4487 type:complete len:81 (-) Transcript_2894:162-404(-)
MKRSQPDLNQDMPLDFALSNTLDQSLIINTFKQGDGTAEILPPDQQDIRKAIPKGQWNGKSIIIISNRSQSNVGNEPSQV